MEPPCKLGLNLVGPAYLNIIEAPPTRPAPPPRCPTFGANSGRAAPHSLAPEPGREKNHGIATELLMLKAAYTSKNSMFE